MDRTEVFQILGIDATKDEQVLKKAYRAKLAMTNPEDDSEGFKRLRTAYEEACRLARQTEDQESLETQRDTTPSGLWVEKAAEIYGNIHNRQNLECWTALFAEDCFLSLEEEENCRLKLLRFLMDHFRLPSDVWKLLDKKLDIVSGASALREFFPADFIRYIVSKCERGEDVEFSRFQGSEDGDYDLFFQYYDRCWQAFQEGNLEQVREYIQNADQLGIYHPVMEICRAELYMRKEKPQEALKLLEELKSKYPKDAMVCYNTAENLWKQGQDKPELRDRAAEIYQELKAENDNHYMANLRLTEWYCDRGRYQDAKKCAEKVLSAGSDPSFMELLARVNERIEVDLEAQYRESGGWEPALELCWCYLQDGKISRGIRLALKLEKLLPPEKAAEYNGLLAKLYVEEAEYETAVTMTRHWEEELEKKLEAGEDEEEAEKDRDRLRQARLIRMQCYHNLGFCDKQRFYDAVREGESVLDDTVKDVGVLLELAQIHIELTEYGLCMELVDKLLGDYQIFAAYATALEAYNRQRDAGGVVDSGRRCIQYFPDFVKPYEYLAKVYLDLKRPEDLRKVLEDAKKNGITSVILDAYQYQMEKKLPDGDTWALNMNLKKFRSNYLVRVEKGQLAFYESGLRELTTYLYRFPDSYMLVERAVFHKAAHHYTEAKEDYEKALALSPANPYAYNGLSQVYKYTGNYEKALVCIKKAILYMDKDMLPIIYTEMADLYSLLGNYEMALAACRQYEQMEKEIPGIWYANKLAEVYMNLGRTQEALSAYQRYQSRQPYDSYRKQADACGKGGRREQAIQILINWKAALDAEHGSKLKRRMVLSAYRLGISNKAAVGDNYCRYHNMAGWVELMTGSEKAALYHFQESLKYMSMMKREKPPIGLLGDAVFAFAVTGNEKLGMRWGKLLNKRLILEKNDAGRFYEQEKFVLLFELLAAYFLEGNAKFEELLKREGSCRICRYCTSPVCREVEGVHILFLLRTGREKEARERLKNNLELQPADEYMLSIRHQIFADSP